MLPFEADGDWSFLAIAPPVSVPGDSEDLSVQTRGITNVPDDVSGAEVIRIWDRTVDITWLKRPRYVFDYSELGGGRIILE